MLKVPKEVEAPPLEYSKPDFDVNIPELEHHDFYSSSAFDASGVMCIVIIGILALVFIK